MSKLKILKLSYPHIEAFPMYANILSVLEGNNIGEPWILNHFIELYSNGIDLIYYDYNYFSCPYLLIEIVSKESLTNSSLSLIDVLINNINENKYVYLAINKAYIISYETSEDIPHDMFIYGYSSDARIFYIADCFTTGKYAYKKCTFDELEMAISMLSECNELWFDGCIYFISLQNADYAFSPNKVKESITNYLNGKPNDSWNNDNMHGPFKNEEGWEFGINTYKFLHMRICKSELSRGNQIFTSLWDHKKHMCKIIEYLNLREYYEVMHILINNAVILRNLYLKYMITEQENILKRMHKLLDIMESYEREIYPQIINKICPQVR